MILPAGEAFAGHGQARVPERDIEFPAVGASHRGKQFLELRRVQLAELARSLRVQPQLIADLDRATFPNTEQLSDGDLRAEFDFATLIRDDAASRSKFFPSGIENGWLTRNEAPTAQERKISMTVFEAS